ncbi:MAG TPA: 30S ribosomal protein S2 [Candidatus Acetothermia bacterium]|nr:30S ribosomal protein S2 [Candidatus Acetothermia bacterium]
MEVLTMKELLETGVHFGHRTRKWNPKMGRYIFTERKGIHIIDLEQTVDMFKKAYFFVRDRAAEGKEILFVGTKKQVQSTIADEAKRCGAHYVNRRWLGGTLTNFVTIKRSIKRMKDLETMMEDGSIDYVPNKEAARLRRELAKLQRNLDGLRHMESVPDILYVIDPDIEVNAVHEANILGIPVVSIVDTNCDPDPIDFPIPGNDDAIKATKLITSRIADAVLEGREGRQEEVKEAPAAAAVTEPSAEKIEETPSATAEEEPVAEEVIAEEATAEETPEEQDAETPVVKEEQPEEAPVTEEEPVEEVPIAVAAEEESASSKDEGTVDNDDKK